MRGPFSLGGRQVKHVKGGNRGCGRRGSEGGQCFDGCNVYLAHNLLRTPTQLDKKSVALFVLFPVGLASAMLEMLP